MTLTNSGRDLRQSSVVIVGYFFVLGVATATWAARLPAIKESLHLGDGRLGVALFAVPAGSVLTLALSGRIADKFGAVRVLRVAGVLNPAALVPIGLARDLAAQHRTDRGGGVFGPAQRPGRDRRDRLGRGPARRAR